MIWHDIRDPQDPKLDELAKQYNLHPLHIEDCRHRNQNAKVEVQGDYAFVVLKPVEMDQECVVEIGDLDFFVGRDYLITVQETRCAALTESLDSAHGLSDSLRPDELFHRLMDAVVDSYNPVLDRLLDRIEEVQDVVLESAEKRLLERILDLRRALIEMRRTLANTRDVVGQILRIEGDLIHKDLAPFLRDVSDHVARGLDRVELQRDLLTGTTEIYLTTVANQTNNVMKALTIVGTIATPALIITGMYGMNIKLPHADAPDAFAFIVSMIVCVSLLLIAVMKKFGWI